MEYKVDSVVGVPIGAIADLRSLDNAVATVTACLMLPLGHKDRRRLVDSLIVIASITARHAPGLKINGDDPDWDATPDEVILEIGRAMLGLTEQERGKSEGHSVKVSRNPAE